MGRGDLQKVALNTDARNLGRSFARRLIAIGPEKDSATKETGLLERTVLLSRRDQVVMQYGIYLAKLPLLLTLASAANKARSGLFVADAFAM